MTINATAPAIANKNERASQLRTESAALTGEIQQLKKKLAEASNALATLQDKRHKFTEDAARGKQPKPSEIADLTAALDQAQIPVDGLTALVNEKQTRLDQVRATLETLEREIADEAQRAARNARFESLARQGREVTAQIAEKIRALIEDALPALDQVRDSLAREYINRAGLNISQTDPEATAARKLIHELEGVFFDGAALRAERALLRQGYTVRGDVVLTIRNLRPVKK